MSRLIVFALILVSTFSFAQSEIAKQEALLNISEVKNRIDRETKYNQFIKEGLFKNKSDYIAYASKTFNTAYSNKDTIRALQMFNILGNYWLTNQKMDSVLKQKPIEPLLKETTPLALHAQIRYLLYDYFENLGNHQEKAIDNSNKSIAFFEKVNDSAYFDWGLVHGDRLISAAKANDFNDIMNHAFASIALMKYQKNEVFLVKLQSILATLYSLNYLFEPAEKLREEAIRYAESNNDYQKLVIENLNASLDAKLQNKTAQQKKYLQQAITYAEMVDIPHLKFISYHSLIVYAGQNQLLEECKTYYKLLEELYPKFKGSLFHQILYLEANAYLAYLKEDLSKATQLALDKLALAETLNSKEIIQESHELLFLIYSASGNSVEATVQSNYILNYLNNTKQNALKNQLLYYQTIFETEKRDLKIEVQESNIALLNEREKLRSQWYIVGTLFLVFTFGVLWLIRSRNFARNKQRLQESFTKDILKTQENERARIAGELHDSIGQKLLILKNTLSGNINKADKEIDLVGETIKEVREMSHRLHPFQFEKLGLVQSLKNMIETFQKNSNVFYSEDIEVSDDSIGKEKAIYIFRILQEALTNVEKHAEATACNLSVFEEKKHIIFTLKDNGKGFVLKNNPTERKGLGMKTLEERARFIEAELSVDSVLKKGTTITLKIPKK